MPKKYGKIKQYETQILELVQQGYTQREIGEKLDLRYIQVRKCVERYNKRQRMIEAGEKLHKRGRPRKKEGELPPSVQRMDKLAQMRYVLASKEKYIKRLEMENELMRDFLSLTERK